MRKSVKNLRISAHGVLQVPKTAKMGTFEGMFVTGVLLEWHNFGQWQSFRGLVDIPRMCLLCVSFGGASFPSLSSPQYI